MHSTRTNRNAIVQPILSSKVPFPFTIHAASRVMIAAMIEKVTNTFHASHVSTGIFMTVATVTATHVQTASDDLTENCQSCLWRVPS